MLRSTRTNPFAKTAVAGIFALSALGLSACGDTAGSEAGTDVEDIQEEAADGYDGVYDSDFYDDVESYDDQEVTVSADVNEVLDISAFTIAGTDDTTVDPLLVISVDEATEIDEGTAVAVTGTVHQSFDFAMVEEEMEFDFDESVFEGWAGEPYIVASSIDDTVAEDE